MIELKTPTEIATMREAGRIVAAALAAVERHATVGTSLAKGEDATGRQ